MDMMCSAHGASPLGGMVPMYALMSAFHFVPWLKLVSVREAAPAAHDEPAHRWAVSPAMISRTA